MFWIFLPLSDAREENPLVVEMLSSSCWERLSLISLTKEKPVEKGPGAEEVEGWEKRLLEPPKVGEEVSSGAKWRCVRLRGGRDSTLSWKFKAERLVEGSVQTEEKLHVSIVLYQVHLEKIPENSSLPVVLVLGSGELRPSRGGRASSLLLGEGGGSWQFWSEPCSNSPPSDESPFLKYFCSQEGTMLLTVSVTLLMRPVCYRKKERIKKIWHE